MASESVNKSTQQWSFEATVDMVEPHERLDRKLYQAASLSALLYGDGLDSFQNNNDTIQEGVLWLLHDLICEAMAAREAESATADASCVLRNSAIHASAVNS